MRRRRPANMVPHQTDESHPDCEMGRGQAANSWPERADVSVHICVHIAAVSNTQCSTKRSRNNCGLADLPHVEDTGKSVLRRRQPCDVQVSYDSRIDWFRGVRIQSSSWGINFD